MALVEPESRKLRLEGGPAPLRKWPWHPLLRKPQAWEREKGWQEMKGSLFLETERARAFLPCPAALVLKQDPGMWTAWGGQTRKGGL